MAIRIQLRPQAGGGSEVKAHVVGPHGDEDQYDDTQDHERCADCKGSGFYVGFLERRLCPTCDGSGWL